MKNYSFSEEEAPTNKGRQADLASCYRHSEIKAQEANERIEEIKRKYDTPSRRERIESLTKSPHLGYNRTPVREDYK